MIYFCEKLKFSLAEYRILGSSMKCVPGFSYFRIEFLVYTWNLEDIT